MKILNIFKGNKYIPSSTIKELRTYYGERSEWFQNHNDGSYAVATKIFWLGQIRNLLSSDKVLWSSYAHLLEEQSKDLENSSKKA